MNSRSVICADMTGIRPRLQLQMNVQMPRASATLLFSNCGFINPMLQGVRRQRCAAPRRNTVSRR